MPLGSVVVVPVVRPESAARLVALAAHVAGPDQGQVVPLTVVPGDATPQQREAARRLVVQAEEEARVHGVKARGLVVARDSVTAGVLEALEERRATLVMMGWEGRGSHQSVFGALIDSILGRSSVPLAAVRLQETAYRRVVLPVSADHLVPAGLRGVELAATLAQRLRRGDATALVLRTGPEEPPLPPSVAALGDRVHHDLRRADVAVGAVARPDDLIVTPVAPTLSGLRAATTHLAWAAPDSSIVVAVDVGPPPQGDVAEAVRGAGEAPPADRAAPQSEASASAAHAVVVTACVAEEPEVGSLLAALSEAGEAGGEESWTDAARRHCRRVIVRVQAPSPSAAIALAMTVVHDAQALRGAEISYDVHGA